MKPALYLDSSVPSYFLVPERDDPIVLARHLLTRRWWDEELHRFDVYISQIVLDELAAGQEQRAAKRVELVRGFELLDVDEDVERAADYYVQNFAMPSRNVRDALHLALASVHEMEYLLTWNYAHLANASKRTHLETLNRACTCLRRLFALPKN